MAAEGKKDSKTKTLIPAGLLIGLGVGWGLGAIVPGVITGLGVGFLLTALVKD